MNAWSATFCVKLKTEIVHFHRATERHCLGLLLYHWYCKAYSVLMTNIHSQYSPKTVNKVEIDYKTLAYVNHIGIVVPDLNETEQRVLALNYSTFNHGDYEPGKRFYFMAQENIEIEVVSYT